MVEILDPSAHELAAPCRGRPKTRFADRTEQVKQNMRLYRARRTVEQRALSRALEALLAAVECGNVQTTFAAAAGVTGIWKASALRQGLLKKKKAPLAPTASASPINDNVIKTSPITQGDRVRCAT